MEAADKNTPKQINVTMPLRHTFATRLSAGGVADHFVTQVLRQGDTAVFKRYSRAKLNRMREALSKLDRQANERGATSFTAPAS